MFTGNPDEAREIYLKYRGQNSAPGGKPWDTLIVNDFIEMRKAGLVHPLMDLIETLFETGE
jgi:hypothetical protein